MTSTGFYSIMQNFGLQPNDQFLAILGANLTEPFNQVQGSIQSVCPEQNLPGNQILKMRVENTSGNIPYASAYVSNISLAHVSSLAKLTIPLPSVAVGIPI
ncbi:MAG: hypothetical protein RLZ12_441 [Bacillota bacterium]|jgi:hypothetical protein